MNATDSSAGPMRVFAGLRIAPEISHTLAQDARVLEQSAVRLVAPADIHLTLVPPWNETSIQDVAVRLQTVAEGFCPLSLTFTRLGYGPRPERPRLLWAECAGTDEISTLRKALLETCGQSDERPFRPHVTLARIRGNGTAIARRHPIERILSLTQEVTSIELFKSPPAGERGYQILASLPLSAVRVGQGNRAKHDVTN
ncbi:RNA 2',3'-cyclic phosphodiesterase [Methylosinus sp. KRF6]|uniref:RNA 2',3'-cyclic phosphodiesterase n=1 Tax=Methylosinus sp. KRF6 TaxID=2846853 RepID=UPI001C0BD9AA|nr:RNA 2',3'-cyclic phosphodiesterase [Methylosinus sp. KRF6]MBU3889769.1 RNA 2',3'-cyclic phosphodiesterase [Methylosinus sp. KRF6]